MTTQTTYDISKMKEADIHSAWKSWQLRIFITIWLTYGSFYLCRANMSFALPGLSAEFGYSKTMLGLLGTALFIMYSIGQFVNGAAEYRIQFYHCFYVYAHRMGLERLFSIHGLGASGKDHGQLVYR
jgi:sugar phosphate permease